jgi:uncharacterized protein YecE (DUF72 family)
VTVYAGTSGYSYAPWKGHFYPEKMPAAKMLGYYATRLPTVEINNTFYRMPKREVVGKWGDEVTPSFRFALKAPQRITHHQKLGEGSEESLRQFHDSASALGDKLGPVLFQLPPFFRQDLPKLQTFLQTLRAVSPEARPAFEFRHASWFVPETYAALAAAGAALCISESEELATPLEATAPWGYLRLRRQDYGEAEIAAWAERIAGQKWGETYVFFKHEDEGKGPRLAEQLLARLGQAQNPAPPSEHDVSWRSPT